MILVEDPYYNEPAHEATRGTDTGKSSAAAYNAELTLNVSVCTWQVYIGQPLAWAWGPPTAQISPVEPVGFCMHLSS
jgi:hypothetical protein